MISGAGPVSPLLLPTLPDRPTFEEAMGATREFLAVAADPLATAGSPTQPQNTGIAGDWVGGGDRPLLLETSLDAAVSQWVGQLVATLNGARGFFVVYLTDEGCLADRPYRGILAGLATVPDIVGDLLVKNLAMSTAMGIHHQRQGDAAIALKSQRVSCRSADLIHWLQFPDSRSQLTELLATLTQGEGSYQEFLERWGYDGEQKAAIAQVVQPLLERLPLSPPA